MMRMTMRWAVAAVVIGVGLQATEADAGFRRFRGCGSCCAAPGCSAAVYVVAPPPVCAGCGPAYSAGFAPSYFPPAYGGVPMMASNPAYGVSPYGNSFEPTYDVGTQPGYGGIQPGYGGSQLGYGGVQRGFGGVLPGYGGVQPAYGGFQTGYGGVQPGFGGIQPGYGGAPPGYGSFGTVPMNPQVSGFGGFRGPGFEYGPGSTVPSNYAPVPYQYTPVPITPATDLVW